MVLPNRTPDVKSVIVLNIRRGAVWESGHKLGVLIEIVVRVQHLVTEELIRLSVEGVGTRFRAEVRDCAGKLSPRRVHIVVLNFEFANRVLSWNDDGQVDVADIQRLTVEVLSALVGKRSRYLIIAPTKGVLADGSTTGSALRSHSRRNRE